MLKKILLFILLLFILLVIGFFLFALPQFEVMTSYTARNGCTAIFLSDRDLDHFKKLELQFSPLHLANIKVDEVNKKVTSDVFGWATKTAYYSSCGCSFKKDQPCPYQQNQDAIDNLPINENTDNIDSKALHAAVDNAFIENKSSSLKNTKAVLVLHKDSIIAEKYMGGLNKDTPLLGWSMTKSIVNTLIGTLVMEGQLSVEDDALIPGWLEDGRKNITIDNLLRMNSGLEWEEEYAIISDVTEMLFKEENIPAYAMAKPLEFVPGEKWEYASGTSNILMHLIRKNIGDELYSTFPRTALFDKVGMHSAFIEKDNYDNFIGSSYGYATARDWARFGLLYLHDGMWNGKRILPEGWVDYTRTPTAHSKGEYGAHFWLNTGKSFFPDCPADMYSASGFHGQRVFILPSQDMVVVRLGDSEDFDMNELVSNIISSVEL